VSERAWFVRLTALALIWVGGVEWLFGRVISRMAASPALEGIGRTIIEVIGRAGLFLISTSFLLALTLYLVEVLHLGATANRRRDSTVLALATFLAVFGVLLAAHAVLSSVAALRDAAWLSITFNVLSLVALAAAATRGALSRSLRATARGGIVLVALAYGTWYYSVFASAVGAAGGPNVPGGGGALLIGEAAALAAPVLFFAATSVETGRWRRMRSWLWPVLAVLLFSAANIADIAVDQGFTGVFTIWSVGFTLYLPWPLYAMSLALFLHALGTCFARLPWPDSSYARPDVGMGLLFLLYAGFYLQLTYQHLLAILAILLLGRLARPFSPEVAIVQVVPPVMEQGSTASELPDRHTATT